MNKKKLTYHSIRIFRRSLWRYAGVVSAIAVSLIILFFAAREVCMNYIWQPYNPIYIFLKDLQALAPYLITIPILIGATLFTCLVLRQMANYFDAILEAAKNLSHPTEEPIVLPEELSDVQTELNLVKEQSLRNQMAAQEAEQRKNDLVVYLAHDLKTPLTSVIGYLNLLQDEPQLSPELRARYTGIALEKAERLETLINEFFDITRFSLLKLTLEPERINLSRMLEQVTFEFQPILAEKQLVWRTMIPPEIELVCDSDKLARVFDNLIRNAVNYSYPNTEITLTLTQTEKEIELVISNHGKTISPDKLARIFDQFFRLDSSRKTATGGAGLGLAIAKEIVELHGGQIQAESADERITFTLRLPKHLS